MVKPAGDSLRATSFAPGDLHDGPALGRTLRARVPRRDPHRGPQDDGGRRARSLAAVTLRLVEAPTTPFSHARSPRGLLPIGETVGPRGLAGGALIAGAALAQRLALSDQPRTAGTVETDGPGDRLLDRGAGADADAAHAASADAGDAAPPPPPPRRTVAFAGPTAAAAEDDGSREGASETGASEIGAADAGGAAGADEDRAPLP